MAGVPFHSQPQPHPNGAPAAPQRSFSSHLPLCLPCLLDSSPGPQHPLTHTHSLTPRQRYYVHYALVSSQQQQQQQHHHHHHAPRARLRASIGATLHRRPVYRRHHESSVNPTHTCSCLFSRRLREGGCGMTASLPGGFCDLSGPPTAS